MNQIELERHTIDVLGESFIRAVLLSAFDARVGAVEMCGRFDAPEASNAIPILVREIQQQLLVGAAERFGHEAPPKKAGGFWNYREISSTLPGDKPQVVMTAATVRKPCAFIRVADYNRTLAASGQGRLFDEIELGECVYVLLLTGRYLGASYQDQRDHRHLPGSVYLAWPGNDCSDYVHTVNLIERYQDVIASRLPKTWGGADLLRYVQQSRRAS